MTVGKWSDDDGAAAKRAVVGFAVAMEAASSVSLSHPEGCPCVVCRAAAGEPDAVAEIVDVLTRDPAAEE